MGLITFAAENGEKLGVQGSFAEVVEVAEEEQLRAVVHGELEVDGVAGDLVGEGVADGGAGGKAGEPETAMVAESGSK